MAIYVFKMKTFSRSAGHRGSRATSAAAYRAGERIRDTRTGAVYDHHRRQDVLHKEIVLPAELAGTGTQPDWARSRESLWNAAELAETRSNARVAREFTLALPHELDGSSRVRLAQRFAHELADRYRHAVDLVIHAPRGDPRNFHAHLLTTTREVTAQGLGRKAQLELSGNERHRRGLARWSEERSWLRERWADLTNEHLRAAHLEQRVSHRFSPTQDLQRAPRLPLAAWHMERAGRRSFIAERIRAAHQERAQRAQRVPAPPSPAPPSPAPLSPSPSPSPSPALSQPGAEPRGWLERARERAQATWLALRQGLAARRGAPAQPQPAPAPAGPAREPAPSLAPQPWPVDEPALQAVRDWRAYRERMLVPGAEPRQNERDGPAHSRQARPQPRREREQELQRDHGLDMDM